MRKTLMLAFGFATLLAAPAVFAQEPGVGKAGTFAISAERLFGVSWTKTKSEGEFDDPGPGAPEDRKFETSTTQFDFLSRGSTSGAFVIPRIGFDYFVINGLSIGGAIGYSTFEEDAEQTIDGDTEDADEDTGNLFLVSPRVGYLFMFTPAIGIWPRGNFTYASAHVETNHPDPVPDEELDASIFNLGLEAHLVIAPVPHVGFTVGPTVDIPIAGSGEVQTGTTSNDLDKVRVTSVGVHAGMLVWF
jgi:hypothetical protein